MIRSSTKRQHPRREGAILIVVLALLALFAVIGLGFIYYADSEANVAKAYRQSQTRVGGGISPPDGQDALNKFLSVLIYDEGYTGQSLLNACRGHSLARSMYGWSGTAGAHVLAYNGIGAIEDPTTSNLPTGMTSRRQLMNFTAVGGNVYDPEWLSAARPAGTAPTLGGTATYAGKNASYTYPDGNNFFLAALDPRTGEVLVPSFHRPAPLGFGSLDPSNPHWTDAAGRYKTLRPRPQENPGFPFVPQNANGTYTGDVQNLIGGVGPQKNDSLFMDIGLQPFQWNGKWIKPIIAPLIVALDGRFNLNTTGNIYGGTHTSFAGYGRWEMNLSRLTSDADAIVQSRQNATTPTSRSGLTARAYNSDVGLLPQYAPINWSSNAAATMALPNGTSVMGAPTFTNYQYNNAATDGANHPSLYNPAEWPAATSGTRSFFVTDTRRLSLRYADLPESYNLMNLSQPNATPLAPTLRGSSPNFNRTDSAHQLRMRFTTLSTGLDVPMLSPMTAEYAVNTYQLNKPGADPSQWHPYPNGSTTPTAQTLPSAPLSNAANVSDFDIDRKMYINKLAALGGVNLNRKLADYGTVGAALTPGTIVANSNGSQAFIDRHNFARDIFARLIVATGAMANVDAASGNVVVRADPAANPNEFEALRYLAQLAANIVDSIDNDDVSTIFAWNPQGGGGLSAISAADQIPQANFDPANIRNCVVFGVEKPRLLINEAYSEFVTDPDEMMINPAAVPAKSMLPKNPVHVRFAIELINPGVTNTNASCPLGSGAVNLFYANGDNGATADINSYQVIVVRDDTGNLMTELRNPDNCRGDLPNGTVPKIQLDFAAMNTAAPIAATAKTIDANNGQYASGSAGFVTLAALLQSATDNSNKMILDAMSTDFSGSVPAANLILGQKPNGVMNTAETTALAYKDDGAVPTDANLTAGDAFLSKMQKHIVILRRLANPYMPLNDPANGGDPALPPNVYVTVDYLNYVPGMDGVYCSSDTAITTTPPRMPKDGTPANENGYDPNKMGNMMAQRFSVGRVQPLAGYFAGATAPTLIDAPNTANHLVRQQPMTPPADGVFHTFGNHNGVDPGTPTNVTLAIPFDWLPHYDRPLANPLELTMVGRCKPHELTQMFLPQSGANLAAGTAGGHLARWFEPFNPAAAVSASNPTTNLYRAFELIRVKPWDLNTPMGGKVHGRVNVNEVPDEQSFQAILDPQGANLFNAGHVTSISGLMLASRTTATNPSAVLADNTGITQYQPGATMPEGGTDHPFTGFGIAQLNTGTGTGLGDTMLRLQAGSATPQTWVPGQDTNGTVHPYLQSEAARKMWHNTTTVSNAFAVWVTVCFFEVDYAGRVEEGGAGSGVWRYPLGKEVYREVPGDLRQQYFSIIDRTNLTLDPTDATRQGPRPFFTELSDNYYPNAMTPNLTIRVPASDSGGTPVIYSDGEAIALTAGMTLFIGTGPDPLNNPLGWATNRERFTASTVSYAGGVATITLGAELGKFYPAGALITNCVPGNPGPQANFNCNSSTYQPVVRDVVKIR